MDFDGIPDDDIWNIEYQDLVFLEEIARGSFGKVFRGTYLGVDVAIKQIFRHDEPAYMKYIEREICVLKGVRHPFIVGFCGVCLHETGLYIVTEFVEGGDVRALLKTSKPEWNKRIQMAQDLAKAMFYLHSKKIIHRDLKSKNLLIGNDGRIRLCDFGFARMSEVGGLQRQAMTICGTPGFVAPEIMLGLDYDEKCDVFSYGNVLAELITLARPGRDFWIRNAEDDFRLDVNELIKRTPKDTPKGFVDLTIKCVAYEPGKRPDFKEIINQLKNIEDRFNNLQTKQTPTQSQDGSKIRGIMIGHRSNNSKEDVMIEKEEVSYLQTISSQKVQLTEGETKISSRHLTKMIQRATNPDYLDSDYLHDLLLTYPCFSSPSDLMHIVYQRYKDTLQSLSESDKNAAKKNQLIGIRTIVFLNTWIERYPDDFTEDGMAELLGEFNQLVASTSKDPINFKKALEKSQAKKGTKFSLKNEPKKPLDTILLTKIPPIDLAKEITKLDFSFYKSIDSREYLKETWKIRGDSNLKTLLDRRTQLGRWVATALVRAENKDQRISILERMIETAQNCLTLKNYNAVFGIMNGLQHPSVERLTKTFESIRPNFTDLLKGLKLLVSKDNSYKAYKNKQEVSGAPSIPFMDVFLEEISYIDNFNPDVGKGGIINFSKHRRLARLIRHIEQFKSAPYQDFDTKTSVRDVLLYSQVEDEDVLQKKSLQCEPPSNTFAL